MEQEYMIRELEEIAKISRTATAQAENCLNMLDKWQAEQEESYKRVSAALDVALEVLNQIKA